jgi:hypothetical protein
MRMTAKINFIANHVGNAFDNHLQQGATVVMACRSLEHAQMSREDILRDPSNAGELLPLVICLGRAAAARRFRGMAGMSATCGVRQNS